jgi:hypothetical protein
MLQAFYVRSNFFRLRAAGVIADRALISPGGMDRVIYFFFLSQGAVPAKASTRKSIIIRTLTLK